MGADPDNDINDNGNPNLDNAHVDYVHSNYQHVHNNFRHVNNYDFNYVNIDKRDNKHRDVANLQMRNLRWVCSPRQRWRHLCPAIWQHVLLWVGCRTKMHLPHSSNDDYNTNYCYNNDAHNKDTHIKDTHNNDTHNNDTHVVNINTDGNKYNGERCNAPNMHLHKICFARVSWPRRHGVRPIWDDVLLKDFHRTKMCYSLSGDDNRCYDKSNNAPCNRSCSQRYNCWRRWI